MIHQNKQDDEWEKDPEYIEIQAILLLGGADARALPHYIKALLSKARQEERERILREIEEKMSSRYNAFYLDISKEDWNTLKNSLKKDEQTTKTEY